MRKRFDGKVSIEIDHLETHLTVSLEASQYRLEAINQYELFLDQSHILLAGKIVTASDEQVKLEYTLPAFAESVSTVIKRADLLERVEIARKFSALKQDGMDIGTFFIHPDNLFLVSNQLYVGHRGLTGSIEPKESDFDHFLTQYKALVVSTLGPKYQYEDVVTGKVKVKDKAFSKILSATTVSEVEAILDEQYHALNLTRKVTERSVKKTTYSLFKFLSVGLAVLAVGMGIWLGLLLENTVPRQTRIIDAGAAFMVSNFNEATAILANDDPRTLPSSVQYMLASSYVQLDNLRLDQRQAVLNNLSPATNEAELRYWIYIGRGQLDEALDIAYSLGSNTLKIHAYGHLYDYVYADMEMPGTEKQNRLTQYLERIEALREELGEGIPEAEEEEAGNGSE